MTLDQWLTAATCKLSDDSTAKVRAEIQEHYQSTYDGVVACGGGSLEADSAAIAALGEPKQANRQYRRVLLTVKEEQMLKILKGDTSTFSPPRIKAGKWLAGIIFAEAFGALAFLAWKKHAIWMEFTTFYYLPIIFTIDLLRRFLSINTPSRGRAYRAVRWLALIATTVFAAWRGAKDPWIFFLGVAGLTLLFNQHRAALRRKVPVNQWPKNLYL
jgi:hypothetical protein